MNLFEYTYNLVRQIPPGRVSSYGAVAKALGDIVASRAVGRMMNQNPDADTMPCYKIVHSDGRVGGFGLGVEDKIRRLSEDGIIVEDGKVVDFEKVLFTGFKTSYPLKKLRSEQISLSKKIVLEDEFEEVKTVAGFDVAYPKNEFEPASGACVVMDHKTGEVLEEKTVFVKTSFPYISTYLAYREFPVIKKLFDSLSSEPTVLMFDGNGVLHPYGFGLASHAGVLLDKPSIGVAKNLLYGEIDDAIVKINNEKRGYVFYSSDKIRKPVFVSPGHKISFETTLEVVRRLSLYKVPEPIRKAHLLAKKTLLSL